VLFLLAAALPTCLYTWFFLNTPLVLLYENWTPFAPSNGTQHLFAFFRQNKNGPGGNAHTAIVSALPLKDIIMCCDKI
jgi:hypothetical protein